MCSWAERPYPWLVPFSCSFWYRRLTAEGGCDLQEAKEDNGPCPLRMDSGGRSPRSTSRDYQYESREYMGTWEPAHALLADLPHPGVPMDPSTFVPQVGTRSTDTLPTTRARVFQTLLASPCPVSDVLALRGRMSPIFPFQPSSMVGHYSHTQKPSSRGVGLSNWEDLVRFARWSMSHLPDPSVTRALLRQRQFGTGQPPISVHLRHLLTPTLCPRA